MQMGLDSMYLAQRTELYTELNIQQMLGFLESLYQNKPTTLKEGEMLQVQFIPLVSMVLLSV